MGEIIFIYILYSYYYCVVINTQKNKMANEKTERERIDKVYPLSRTYDLQFIDKKNLFKRVLSFLEDKLVGSGIDVTELEHRERIRDAVDSVYSKEHPFSKPHVEIKKFFFDDCYRVTVSRSELYDPGNRESDLLGEFTRGGYAIQ